MAKTKTPHLNSWMQTFKNVGSMVGRSTVDALKESTPSFSGTVSSAADTLRESREFISKTKTQLAYQNNLLSKNKIGRNAKDIINSAYNDIKNGSYSLDRLGDDSFDAIDDFDSSISDDTLDLTNPDAVALHESKKNTAILGKVVAEGNAASIEGMKHMTKTLSNVNIKTTNAAVGKLTNVMLMGINQTNAGLAGVNNKLDMVNANLSAMINFQNQSTLASQQAALAYYENSTKMLNKMGEILAGVSDGMNKNANKNGLDVSYGLDLKEYSKFIKDNFNNTAIGSMMGFGKTALSMSKSMGMNPMDMVLSTAISGLMGPKVKKSLERFDKTFSSVIEEGLYKIGDMRHSGDFFKSMMGEVLGLKRPEVKKAIMGNFKKDAMGWNGIAQQTLVEVIPSYLSKIESAITKQQQRHYDMETGRFINRDELKKKYTTEYHNNMEFGMKDFTTKLSESFGKIDIDERDRKRIQDSISKMVSEQLMGTSNMSRDDLRKNVRNTMRGTNMNETVVNDILKELEPSLRNTTKVLNEFASRMEKTGNVYRNLNNTHGKDMRDLETAANLFSGTTFYNGKSFDFLSDEEKRQYKEDHDKKEQEKKLKSKARREAEKHARDNSMKGRAARAYQKWNNRGSRTADFMNSASDTMYRFANGYDKWDTDIAGDGFVMQDPSVLRTNRAKKSASKRESGFDTGDKTFHSAMSKSKRQIEQDAKKADQAIKSQKGFNNRVSSKSTALATSRATDGANVIGTGNSESESSLKALVLGLHADFLQPLVGGLFGKEGFFSNIWKNDHVQKGIDFLKKKLFTDKDALFSPMVDMFKEQANSLKYVITGKGYTKRDGTVVKDTNDSITGHLANGYDFIFKNTMKYVFGEDFEKSDTYNKYFKWMDWKGKRTEKQKKAENKGKINDQGNQYAGLNEYELPPQKSLESGKTPLLLGDSKKSSKLKEYGLVPYNPSNSADIRSQAEYNIITASQNGALEIMESSHALSTNVIGDYNDDKKVEDVQKKSNETFMSKLKKHLPKDLAAGVIGAGVGTSLGLTGTGIIGSLFLPGGPIGGALLGVGISMLSRSEGFNKFLFGEKNQDGKRLNGLISNKTQEFFKKNMPLVVGGATLGAIKGLFRGTAVANTGFGVLLNTLLPGGPIGGAIIGTGLALLKNNDKIHNILFGEKDADGKKMGGLFSKGMGGIGKVIEKSGNFIKGGLKGLGTGAFTGVALSKAGIIGASLTAGGPIGMGIAGLGLGIAAQTNKFKEILFGTEEFDEDGNSKGRMKNGLLYKVRNMLVMNVFEPIKDKISEKAIDFAYWAKDKIEYPFRLAFGPILDSLSGIKKNVSDAIHDAFNNVAKTVGDTLKSTIKTIFSPFTRIMGMVGKALLNTVSFGAKAALAPISAPLKILQALTSPTRFKENMTRRKSLFENAGGIYQGIKAKWNNEDDEAEYGTGLMGNIKKHLGHFKDLKNGWDTANFAYNDAMGDEGMNHLNWRNIKYEKRSDKAQKKDIMKNRKAWSKINKLRKEINEENGNAELRVSDDKLKQYQKKFGKLGINKDWISNTEDLDMLIHNREDWKDKFDPTRDKSSKEYISKNGLKIQETNAQIKARIGTESYQKEMMTKFSEVTKLVTKIATQEALKKKKNLSVNDIKTLNKQISEKGLSWKELDIDPSELLNLEDVSDADWEEFMKDRDFKKGDKRKRFKGFNDLFYDKYLKSKDESEAASFVEDSPSNESTINFHGFKMTKDQFAEFFKAQVNNGININDWATSKGMKMQSSFNRHANEEPIDVTDMQPGASGTQAIVNELQAIKTSTEANEYMNAAQVSTDTGISNNDLNRATNIKHKPALFTRIKNSLRKKIFGSKEEEESNAARGLHGVINGDKDEDSKDSAGIEGIENANNTEKKGFFSTITGFFGKMFGSLGSWMSNTGIWTKLGIGTAIMGLFGNQIMSVGSTVFNFLGKNVAPILKEGIKKIGSWWSANGEGIISSMTQNIVNSMSFIVSNAATIAWSAVKTMGKMAINGIADFIPGMSKPFPEVDTSNKTFSSKEEADATGKNSIDNGDGTYTVTGAYDDVDENGNISAVGKAGMLDKVPHALFNVATQKGTRTAVGKMAKAGLKTAGWATGLIPGGKVVKGAVKLGTTAVKGTTGIVKAVTGKGLIEETQQAAAKGVGKAAAEAVVKEESGGAVKKIIKLICDKMKKVGGKLTKWIPVDKFTKFVVDLSTKLTTKLTSCNSKTLQKLAARVSEKTAAAAGKTAAMATVVVQVGLSAYDAISGFCEAAYLFEVDNSAVTFGMRSVSSILKCLLGLGIGPWIDILLEIGSMLFNTDFKKTIATWLYKIMPGVDDEAEAALDKAQLSVEIETQNYNDAHNTNLSTDAYNEKKNAKWYTKAWNAFTGKGDDYSKYAASDAQIAAAQSGSSTSSSASIKTTQSDINAYDGKNDVLAYGPGKNMRSRALSYGTMTQSDARWGNYQLGQFPDGSPSTMSTGGCGPTALSMAANSLGKNTNPLSVAQYAKSNGYIADGGATADLFTNGAKSMGMRSSVISKSNLKDSLGNGNPVVIAGKSNSGNSPYTQAGHVLMASGIDSRTGKAIVNDPMYDGQIETDISKLTDGMTHGWSYSSNSVGNGVGPIGFGKIIDFMKSAKDWYTNSNAGVAYLARSMNPVGTMLNVKNAGKSFFSKDSVKDWFNNHAPGASGTNGPAGTNRKDYDSDEEYEKQYLSKLNKNKKTGANEYSTANLTVGEMAKQGVENIDWAAEGAKLNASKNASKTDKTLTTVEKIKQKMKEGSAMNASGVMNWQDPSFYNGMTVGDIKAIANYDNTLKSDSEVSLFGEVYRTFVRSKKYADNHVLTTDEVTPLLEAAKVFEDLGGYGTNGDYQYKNGFPFYPTKDDRWKDISWRNSTVEKRGSDLSSLGMIASAFGTSLIPPNYITEHWLKDHPEWKGEDGINESKVLADGGYNALKSTQMDGKRVRIVSSKNTSTILSALKQRKPVYLSGYRYNGSLFGGDIDPDKVDITDPDAHSSIVAVYANDNTLALNDPFTTNSENALFPTSALNDMIGKNSNISAVKSAYIVSTPSGSGLDGAIDLSSKIAPTSQFTSVKDAKGIGKIGAIFSNFAAMGSNLLDSLLGGTPYQSIMSDKLADDEADDAGIGTNVMGSTSDTTTLSKSSSDAGKDYIPGMPSSDYYKMKNKGMSSSSIFNPTAAINNIKSLNKNVSTPNNVSIKAGLPSPGAQLLTNTSANKHGGNGTGFGIGYGTGNSDFNYMPTSDLGLMKQRQNTTSSTTETTDTTTETASPQVSSITDYGDNSITGIFQKLSAVSGASLSAHMGQEGGYQSALLDIMNNNASSSTDDGTDSTAIGANVNFTTTSSGSTDLHVPEGIGHTHPYMGWGCIKKPSSDWTHSQWDLKSAVENYDKDGFGLVGDRYAVAMKEYYGGVGDYLDITQKDGTVYKVALADIKGKENASEGEIAKYAHGTKATGYNMVEFVVNKDSWYGTDKSVGQFHPEWCKDPDANIAKIERVGSYWNDGNAKSSSVGNGPGKIQLIYDALHKNAKSYYGPGRSYYGRAIGRGGSWLETVQKVKKAIADQQPGYSMGKYIKITIDGKTESVRTDCSGFVSACCRYYGANVNTNSGGFMTKNMPEMTKMGFQYAPWPGWDKLKSGDIITCTSHIEIFAGTKNGQHYVYNCGSDASVNNPNATVSGHSSYSNIWRPADAGSVVDLYSNQSASLASTSTVSTNTLSTTGSNNKTYANPLTNIFGKVISSISTSNMADYYANKGKSSVGNGPGSFFENTLNGQITSGYGSRSTELGNEYHRGIDIGAENGQSILSPISGQVVASGSDVAGYGNYTVIRDGKGNNHLFAHMNKPSGYGLGSFVSQNDIIGEVGSTGKATGNHLHYEIRKSGNKYSTIDPNTYKYDSNVSKNLNINKSNTSTSTDAIGTGNKDISANEISDKLSVALNADGVEDKLNTLIEVVKAWSDRDAKRPAATSLNQTTNNTTVAYGNGSKKKSTSTKKSNSFDITGMNLATIHNAIASK